MKKIVLFSIICIALFVFQNMKVDAQCEACNAALNKDYMQYASTTIQQLNILRVINEQTFEEFKKSEKSSGGLGIDIPDLIGATLSGSSEFNEFDQKRKKLFDLYSYNFTSQQAENELKIVTNPIAYKFWSTCISKCYDSDPDLSKVYAYVTNADKDYVFIEVKYKANQVSAPEQKCIITIGNGTVLKETSSQGVKYVESLQFKLGKQCDRGFTIKRTNNEQNTVISISAEGANVFHETSKYQPPVQDRSIKAILNYSIHQTTNEKVGEKIGTIQSPDLHNIRPNDRDCGKKGGYGRGDFCAAKNIIKLPDIDRVDQYYTNFSSVYCVSDNKGAAGWSLSQPGGLGTVMDINPDKRKASVSFITGSRNCWWGWKADIYQKHDSTVLVNVPIDVKQSYFVISVPDKAIASSLLITINGDQHVIKPGDDHPEHGIRFINKTDNGINTDFEYFIK